MMLIDRDEQLICSPIIESVQVRTFLKIEPQLLPEQLRMQEFVMDREQYIAGGKRALRAVDAGDREPTVFESLDIDWFESGQRNDLGRYEPPDRILESCIHCHHDSGVLSMNSYTRLFSPAPATNPQLQNLSFDREITITVDWKKEQASWGMLRGYWEAGDR